MENSTIRCYKCRVPMETVHMVYEARGVMVKNAEGLRCPRCGLEAFTSAQSRALEQIIYSLVPPVQLARKISSAAGKKPVIYLPQEILTAVGGKIGDNVRLFVSGPGRFMVELQTAEDIEVDAADFPARKRMANVPVLV